MAVDQRRASAIILISGAAIFAAMALLGHSADAPSNDVEALGETEKDAALEEAIRLADLKAAERNQQLLLIREAEQYPMQPSLSPSQAWAASVLASGRPLTLREFAAISQILDGQTEPTVGYSGYSEPAYEPRSSRFDSASARNPSRSVLGHTSASQALLERQKRQAAREHAYEGASGARYKYDLSDPSGQLRYEMDPMAQMRDSTSIDPRRDIDQSTGQYGGGIEY